MCLNKLVELEKSQKHGTVVLSKKAADRHATTTSWMAQHPRRPSLFTLSTLWLLLCSGLVYKYHQLSLVFFAFCASFALAFVLMIITIGSNNSSNSQQQQQLRRIKAVVGLAACSLQWYYYLALEQESSAHRALSVAAGYLAFDHWYSALYLHQHLKSVVAVLEDAATLITMIVVLVLCMRAEEEEGSSWFVLGDDFDSKLPSAVAGWTLYKALRLFAVLVFVEPPQPKALTAKVVTEPLLDRQTPNTKGVALQSFSSVQKSKKGIAVEEPLSSSITPVSPSLLWSIHGVTYDLTSYVEQHPGGREAILLGQGRQDCTALFQSYHPFTAVQASQILRKYRVEQDTKVASATTTTTMQKDAFYEILCQRVAQTLQKEHGFDPIADRAATPRRALYYFVVWTAVVITGVAHCRVSPMR